MTNQAKEGFHQDTMGEWFRELPSHLQIRIPIALFRKGKTEPEWFDYNHRYFDGVGALIHILEQDGFTRVGSGAMSKIVDPKGVRRWMSLLRFFLHSFRKGRLYKASPWKQVDNSKLDAQHSCGIAWCRFPHRISHAFEVHARQHSASLNSFLLHSLNNSIPANRLHSPQRPNHWRVPVNLRGKLHLPSPYSNHSTWLDACLPAKSSLHDTHSIVKKEIKTGMPWLHYQLATYLVNKNIDIDIENEPHHCGAMSNLGNWPDPSLVQFHADEPCDIEGILFVPPMHKGSLLSAGIVTFNGQLHLALQTHPALANTQPQVEAFLRGWVEEMAGQAGQSAASLDIGFTPRTVLNNAQKCEQLPEANAHVPQSKPSQVNEPVLEPAESPASFR